MPEPLKNLYNENFISSLADRLKDAYQNFNTQVFQKSVIGKGWDELELKQRMQHVAVTLRECLPDDFDKAIEILKPVSLHFSGLEHMVFPAFVEFYGMGQYETSMSALEFFTPNSSSEFAIRPFIKKSPVKTMKQMELWAESDNDHVRRLASEGCRPRLPWAMALPVFKRDPGPVMKILEKLKCDESEYVRRSVANNLNDISKDHPELVINTARTWLGDSPEIDRLVKHACRTLLKQGDTRVLKLFGFASPQHVSIRAFVLQPSVNTGEKLKFSFELYTQMPALGKLRVEYAIDFMKKNGQQSRKIFSISESLNHRAQKVVIKNHSFKLITTRKYYPGIHGLAVFVNGQELTRGNFMLI